MLTFGSGVKKVTNVTARMETRFLPDSTTVRGPRFVDIQICKSALYSIRVNQECL